MSRRVEDRKKEKVQLGSNWCEIHAKEGCVGENGKKELNISILQEKNIFSRNDPTNRERLASL